MKETRNKTVLIILFAAVILLPFPLWAVLGGRLDFSLNENRTLAEKPVFSLEEIDAYPQAYEAWLNDHLPFRSLMIRSYNTIEYRLLRSTLSYMVLYGKDGWLFHRDRYDGDPISLYRGLRIPQEEHLEQIRNNMLTTRDNLAKEGVEFILFFTPLKERMYAEYMPDAYGAPAEHYALQTVVDYLRETTDLRIVYPYEEMQEAKEALGEDGLLFYKADSHWNELGAYVGTVPLLREMGIALPPYDSEELTITTAPADKEDLSWLANIEGMVDPGITYSVTGYDKHDLVCTGGDFNDRLSFEAKGADPRRVLMKHDSFAEAMEDVFCSQFSETLLAHNFAFTDDDFDNELVDGFRPDVFVYEIGERNCVGALMGYVYE